MKWLYILVPYGREAAMNEAAVKKNLDELNEAMTALPGSGTAAPAGVYEPQAAGGASVQDALDYLRLQVTYLLFDLEATRRENRYLRQMLESRPQKEDGSDMNGF